MNDLDTKSDYQVFSRRISMADTTTTERERADVSRKAADELQHQKEDFQALVDDIGASVTAYCKARPMVAGFALFAAGFYVGWRIKPW
jgi:hypothetical protein